MKGEFYFGGGGEGGGVGGVGVIVHEGGEELIRGNSRIVKSIGERGLVP